MSLLLTPHVCLPTATLVDFSRNSCASSQLRCLGAFSENHCLQALRSQPVGRKNGAMLFDAPPPSARYNAIRKSKSIPGMYFCHVLISICSSKTTNLSPPRPPRRFVNLRRQTQELIRFLQKSPDTFSGTEVNNLPPFSLS